MHHLWVLDFSQQVESLNRLITLTFLALEEIEIGEYSSAQLFVGYVDVDVLHCHLLSSSVVVCFQELVVFETGKHSHGLFSVRPADAFNRLRTLVVSELVLFRDGSSVLRCQAKKVVEVGGLSCKLDHSHDEPCILGRLILGIAEIGKHSHDCVIIFKLGVLGLPDMVHQSVAIVSESGCSRRTLRCHLWELLTYFWKFGSEESPGPTANVGRCTP